VKVASFPLNHRIYTNGFLFQEKNKERKLNIEQLEAYNIDKLYYQKVKYGGDITLDSGEVIPNEALSFDPQVARSYAFCSDTRYDESIIPFLKNATVIYHESTFLEKEAHLAERTLHSTAKQAATIAKLAEVKSLILGHFSTRYEKIELFKEEARTIFEQVFLADDGKFLKSQPKEQLEKNKFKGSFHLNFTL
jgi:ribonuclease Z